jgi:hypothetical protein
MPKYDSIDPAKIESQIDEDIDKLIKDGQIRAGCHSCGAMLDSINDKVCTICKTEIDQDRIKLFPINWSEAN